MNKIKNIITIGWIVTLGLLSVAVIVYLSNENQIKKYNDQKYEVNNFTTAGVTEPYINHYNNGNVYYAQGDYAHAIEEYNAALEYKLPEDKDCDVRVNLALAMVVPIDVDDIDASNIDDVFDTLDAARDILCDNGCASEKKKGHDKDAQKLKKDIDEFEDMLRNSASGQGTGGSDDPNTDPKPQPDYNELEQQIKYGRDEAYRERGENLNTVQHKWSADMFDYNGNNW